MESDFDIQAFIRQKIAALEGFEEKRLLQDMMEQVFLGLHAHTEDQYTQLKRRIYDEIPARDTEYAIYTSVMHTQELAMPHRSLHPMCGGDLHPKLFAAQTQELILETVFWQAPTPEIETLLPRLQGLSGTLNTESGAISAQFYLRPARRYFDAVRQLYESFLLSGIPWRTLCCPHIFHFFDVVAVLDHAPEGELVYTGYHCDDIACHNTLTREFVPVWNVELVQAKSQGFPEPTIDRVNFEYRFDLRELPAGEYLAPTQPDILAARREKNMFILVSRTESRTAHQLVRICKPEDGVITKIEAPVFCNHHADSYAGRLPAYYQQSIRTKGEVIRLLSAMGMEERFSLWEIRTEHTSGACCTYDTEPFLSDELRDNNAKKELHLLFAPKQAVGIFDCDLISYYCMMVGRIYPEYHVRGSLQHRHKHSGEMKDEGVAL